MPWFPFPWSDVIKKKVCRYLLQRYLGQFLDEKLSLEQLNVDLYNGTGTVSNIALYAKSLNELCESQKWPVEVVEGHLGSVTVNVPWNALMSEDGYIEIANLYLAVKPRPNDATDGKSVLESMFSSMSSSMQLAQDCMERERLTPANLQATAMEGLEKFAMTIDNVLNRIKAKLFNTELRIEYILPEEGSTNRGLALIIKIGHIEYENEAGKEMKSDEEAATLDKEFDEESVARGSNSRTSANGRERDKVYYLSAYAIHHITMADISVFTEEFTIVEQKSAQSASSMGNDDDAFMESTMGSSERFYSTMSEFPIPSLQPSVLGLGSSTASSNASTDDEDSNGAREDRGLKIYSSGELQIAALNGPHEIRLSMKQSESVLGPNVELEVNLGVLEVLLGPRQCHMLNVVLESFSPTVVVPPVAGKTRSSRETQMKSQPMNYKEEISDRRSQFNNMSGGFTYGQSTQHHANYHDRHSQNQDDWQMGGGEAKPNFTTRGAPDVDSLMSSSSSMSSSMSSASTMVTRNSSRSRRTVTMGQEYDSVIMSTYICRIGGIVGVLLHDDILMDTESSAICYGPPLTDQSCQQMKILAGGFFGDLRRLKMVAELRQLANVEVILNRLVPQYQLRLVLATIVLEGEEKRNPKENLLHFTASIMKTRLMEVLGTTRVPLLDFYRGDGLEDGNISRAPDIQMTYQSLQKVHILSGIEYLSEPVVKCRFNVTPCLVELDISIYDRLKVLSESYPFQVVLHSKLNSSKAAEESINQSRRKKNSPALTFKLDFESVDVHLRFPVADLRPVHDPQRMPWWERNVRSDYLVVQLKTARVTSGRTDIISIEADEINLSFVESEIMIPLGNCKGKVDPDTQTHHCPTILIDLSEVPTTENDRRSEETVLPPSQESRAPPSPFARSRTCRESDTPHRKGCTTTGSEESEILVMPGNQEELKTFTEFALKNSKTRLTIDIPSANVQLKSKHIYEVLYNRINSDLLLWTPGSHQLVIPASGSGAADLLFNVGLMDSIYAPSVIHDIRDSNSDSDDDAAVDSEESDELYAFRGQRKGRRRRQARNAYERQTNNCDFALCLQVDEAVITMFPPARNAHNQVIPEQHGELVLRAERLKLMSVKGFCGNENLGYVCLDADALSASHCGLIPLNGRPTEDEYLLKTLYPTPDGFTLNGKADHQSTRKMLSLALQMRLCPEQEMKRLRLAAVVHTATLRHNPTVSEQSWLMELMDMFDVLDYPIPGYKPNGVITEMHIHLWDCAIDYRPLYFPFRAVGMLGNLEISTNITSPSMGCTLRFVAEDSALSLGPQLVQRRGRGSAEDLSTQDERTEPVVIFNDKRDLVCVLELGLFEISLRLNDRETRDSLSPRFDLRAAVHDVHIRTCSDSARALAEFLGYVASEGDLNHRSDEEDDSDHNESEYVDNESMDLLSAAHRRPEPEMAEVAQTKQRHVTNLMEEAMIESRRNDLELGGASDDEAGDEDEEGEFGDELFLRTGTDVFFFPDEGAQLKLNRHVDEDVMTLSVCAETLEGRSDFFMGEGAELEEPLPQVQEDLGEIPSHSRHYPYHAPQAERKPAAKLNSSDATDEDYCIIGDEEKVAFEPSNLAEPVDLTEEPIRIVDNHFNIPSNKTDLLQAPPDFPMATVRYTLCEMTITWHLYGGSDFSKPVAKTSSSSFSGGGPHYTGGVMAEDEGEVVYLGMSDAYKQGVSYSNGAPKRGMLSEKSGPTLTWKTSGGPDRRHDVLIEFQLNRVRFSHETYSQLTKQASRQVLLVHEFEIRDKLAVSNINKLLYNNNNNYAFGPLRSPKHMLMIEAVHIRPDAPLPAQECCLRVSLSPLRLNIDQDALLFLFGFFQEFSGSGATEDEGHDGRAAGTDGLNSTERTTLVDPPAPVLMVELPEAEQELQARKMVSENLKLLMEEEGERERLGTPTTNASTPTTATYDVDEGTPTYFRSVRFEPAVKIRIDYHGKRVELSRGPLAGLIMGLGQLQASEFKLKAIRSKQGFLGVEALLNYFIRMWLQDIKKNQLPSILSGVGPMNAFVQLFQGIFDLFWMPIEQFKKDGKLVRGIQRGAKSFTARTALAALEITTRLIYILQLTAETAYDMVSPGPRTLRRGRGKRGKKKKNRVHQPQDIREGMVNAYQIVRDGIGETVQNILDVAALEHDQKGYTGAVGAVVREIPSTIVRPIVLATQATNYVLGGVKNQLVPDARTEAKEKWKADEE